MQIHWRIYASEKKIVNDSGTNDHLLTLGTINNAVSSDGEKLIHIFDNPGWVQTLSMAYWVVCRTLKLSAESMHVCDTWSLFNRTCVHVANCKIVIHVISLISVYILYLGLVDKYAFTLAAIRVIGIVDGSYWIPRNKFQKISIKVENGIQKISV